MLIRSTWTCVPQEATVLPKTYRLELTKLLHQQLGIPLGNAEIATTTFSGLLGRCTASNDYLSFQQEECYQLVMTGLCKETSNAISTTNLPDPLTFLGATFHLSDRQDTITHYEDLYHRCVASEPQPTRRLHLQFQTPTAFSQNRSYLPLPLPALMFRSWIERWNHFAPVYLGGDELVGYLSQAIFLKRHKIQTRSLPIHKGWVTGFVGDVWLQMPQRSDPLLAQVAHLLCEYAHFAGTGVKTRLGMGTSCLI